MLTETAIFCRSAPVPGRSNLGLCQQRNTSQPSAQFHPAAAGTAALRQRRNAISEFGLKPAREDRPSLDFAQTSARPTGSETGRMPVPRCADSVIGAPQISPLQCYPSESSRAANILDCECKIFCRSAPVPGRSNLGLFQQRNTSQSSAQSRLAAARTAALRQRRNSISEFGLKPAREDRSSLDFAQTSARPTGLETGRMPVLRTDMAQ